MLDLSSELDFLLKRERGLVFARNIVLHLHN